MLLKRVANCSPIGLHLCVELVNLRRDMSLPPRSDLVLPYRHDTRVPLRYDAFIPFQLGAGDNWLRMFDNWDRVRCDRGMMQEIVERRNDIGLQHKSSVLGKGAADRGGFLVGLWAYGECVYEEEKQEES